MYRTVHVFDTSVKVAVHPTDPFHLINIKSRKEPPDHYWNFYNKYEKLSASLMEFPNGAEVVDVAMHEKDKWAVASSLEGKGQIRIECHRPYSGDLVETIYGIDVPEQIQFSPDGDFLLVHTENHKILVCDWNNKKVQVLAESE